MACPVATRPWIEDPRHLARPAVPARIKPFVSGPTSAITWRYAAENIINDED